MTDTTELLEAAKAVLPYLEASTDHRDGLLAIDGKSPDAIKALTAEMRARERISPADRLRQQAEELEAKDAVIKRFRAAVAALAGEAQEGA